MRENYPVTQHEYDFPADDILVSTTDLQGKITHCNHAFEATSGYTYDELMGQPHNLVRHPDMPPDAYADPGFEEFLRADGRTPIRSIEEPIPEADGDLSSADTDAAEITP